MSTSISANKNLPIDEGVDNIYRDITNAAHHALGDHRQCHTRYCAKEKSIASSTIAEVEHSALWFRLKVILQSVASKSRSLLEDVDTNSVERFNSIIAKFVGGKRINFTTRRAYQSRCNAAVVSYNTNRPLYTLHKKMLGKSPRNCIKRLDRKRDMKRKQANMIQRKKIRKRLFQQQNDYGSKVAAPDMSEEDYEKAKADFIKNLESLVSDRNGIQERTARQRESGEWLEIRKLLLTASNFGAVIKRKKNFHSLVNNILYRSNLSSIASVAHGIKHEPFALQQLARQENVIIEECGLFVDLDHPFIGATPDGRVGNDMIVEVKCPVAAFKLGLATAIAQNKVQILKHNKKNGSTIINQNSTWYYQVQGQLHVADKKRCLFGIWGGENEPMEVLYINRDDQFWKDKMEQKIIHFYHNHILPELLDSRKARGMVLRGAEISNKK